jgi:branched-subunit amino acid ABC-type transport system permease component
LSFLLTQALNGLVYSMLLFLLSAGLSLIFGLMRVVNLTHGSFYMLGAYLGLAILNETGSFFLALAIAPILTGLLGAAFEILVIRRIYRRPQIDQVLLTFGFTFIALDLVQSVWGNTIRQLPPPPSLAASVALLGATFPLYRLFLIGLGCSLALLLFLVLERSRIGAMVRAGVDDAAMASGLGIDVEKLFTCVFAASVALAALAGVAAGPVLGLYPGMDSEILVVCFIVVVSGGMGSLRGALVGSLLIGEADIFGRAYLPVFAMFLVYALMILLLLLRPAGLFGVRQNV